MFDNLDNLSKPKDSHEDSTPEEERNINLLPHDFKESKKHKAKSKFKLSGEEFHLGGQKNRKYPMSEEKILSGQPRKFLLSKFFSFFKHQHKKEPSRLESPQLNKKESSAPEITSSNLEHKSAEPSHISAQVVNKTDDQSSQPVESKADEKDKTPLTKTEQIRGMHKEKKGKQEEELDVNLLPKREQRLTDKQMVASYIMIIIIGLLIVLTPYIFYKTKSVSYQKKNVLLERQIQQISQKNREIQKQIEDFGPLSRKLTQLLSLLDKHIYWSNFFPTLERHTVRNVYFVSLAANNDKTINLQGRALSLRDLAEQLIVFQNSQVYSNTQLESLAFIESDESGKSYIEFSISFSLDPKTILADNQQDGS